MTDTKNHFIGAITLILFSVVLGGCSVFSDSDDIEPPVELKTVISAGSNINPSDNNNANPVVVNVYQLKSTRAFESAQVLDLLLKDTAVLAEDLIRKDTLDTVLPADKRTISLAIDSSTQYLAVFGQFSNYSQAKTKAWVELKELDDIEHINISVESLSINITSVEDEGIWPW
jgi:type VI secretion system protein VasD